MLDRAQFLAFAGDDEIGRADLVGMALPRDGLAEAVEFVLVGNARHIHETLLERRRRLLEDRVAARLVAYRHGGEGAHARLVRGKDGAEEGPEAGAGAADALGVDLTSAREPVDQRLADRHPGLHRAVDADQWPLILDRA